MASCLVVVASLPFLPYHMSDDSRSVLIVSNETVRQSMHGIITKWCICTYICMLLVLHFT